MNASGLQKLQRRLDYMGGGFTRVPTVLSGNPAIMELDFDRFGGNRQSLGHLEVPVRSVVEGGNRVPIPAVVTTR